MNDNSNRKNVKKIQRIHLKMVLVFMLMILVSVVIIARITVRITDKALKNEAVSLTTSLNVQMKLNVESYISRMQNLATLVFAEELAYTYDATDPDNDEYEAINTESELTEKLYGLCIMENFVDYGIVYRNNRTVGKLSNGTATLFGDKLYKEIESMISNESTEDGWQIGYKDDYRRLYYVKRVHENAVLFVSFYTYELNDVFDNPETLSDMDIRLVDENNRIIYSKKGEKPGSILTNKIKKRIRNKESFSSIDDDYLISVNNCDKWLVICSIPTHIILREKNVMVTYIYAAGFVVALIVGLFGLFISRSLIRIVDDIVYKLDTDAHTDLLTGLLNKLTFEEVSDSTIRNSLKEEKRALIIIDLDDFKYVNDNYGHAAGDKLIENIGKLLTDVFSKDDYIGRIGGDEFCVLMNTNLDSDEKLMSLVRERCEKFSSAIKDDKISKEIGGHASASIGIALFSSDAKTFESLYALADKALYKAKNAGKNTYEFYSEVKDD